MHPPSDLAFRRGGVLKSAMPSRHPVVLAPVDEAAALNAELLPVILARAERSAGRHTKQYGRLGSRPTTLPAGPARLGVGSSRAAVALADSMTALQGEDGLARVALDWKVNAWANVNPRTAMAMRPTHHPGCFWSCVYWVQTGEVGDGGEFEIQDPRGILPGFVAPSLRYALPGCLSAGGSDFIVPGSRHAAAVFRPGWSHAVRPFRGAEPRISVAINLAPYP